jgi:hypothetical protein|tara:strand:- start:161 stop:319 length:159 start_codon:yes stop_codon:yes gene_type:complete
VKIFRGIKALLVDFFMQKTIKTKVKPELSSRPKGRTTFNKQLNIKRYSSFAR